MQFTRNSRTSKSFIGLIVKIGLLSIVILFIVFFLNQIHFPSPKKNIEKIIPNENFKVVK